MQAEDILNRVRDIATVRQVFGEPYEKGRMLVVPVASIWGGGGGGNGTDLSDGSDNGRRGWGGGFGLFARPLGVYVIRDGSVSWQPAVDVTRLVLHSQLVAIAPAPPTRSLSGVAGGR